MFANPAVTVHGIDQARRALGCGHKLTLISAPGAALYAGCLFWRALVEQADREWPGLLAADILDCGDTAGRALEAMRIGQRALVLSPTSPGFAEVARIARANAIIVLRDRPTSLDLADRGSERRLAAWLASGTSAFVPPGTFAPRCP